MFAIGQAKSKVFNGKVAMPKEYRLKTKILKGKWKNEKTLYLSDSDNALNFIAGKYAEVFEVNIDSEDRLQIPIEYETDVVNISGCVSTIELLFINR